MNTDQITAEAVADFDRYLSNGVPNYYIMSAADKFTLTEYIKAAIEKWWQTVDMMYLYHNDAKFHRFVQEAISNYVHRTRAAHASEGCAGPRQHGHPLIYESHCEHGETEAHLISEPTVEAQETQPELGDQPL